MIQGDFFLFSSHSIAYAIIYGLIAMFYSRYISNSKNQNQTQNKAKRNARTNRRLVWHSNIGASSKVKSQSSYKPLASGKGKKKTVHFSTVEVQPFHFDWSLADDVFYTRTELTSMGKKRFEDASVVRSKLRSLTNSSPSLKKSDPKPEVSRDDTAAIARGRNIDSLLSRALDDEDVYEGTTIRGIEHFVYPELQKEMILRKKQVQREVMDFVRCKTPDPQGWRLARHSSTFSQWARNVAQEKGLKYCINNSLAYPECEVEQGSNMDERLKQSQDELEGNLRALRGTSSFSLSGASSFNEDDDGTGRRQSDMHDIEEEEVEVEKYEEDVVNTVTKGQERYNIATQNAAVQTTPTCGGEAEAETSVELSVEASFELLLAGKGDDEAESKRENSQSPCQKTGEE